MFDTVKAAREAGFRERKIWEYGGEEIYIKGRLLVRNPKEAQSQTEWSRRGYHLRQDAEPHCQRSVHFAGRGSITYPVYREDQVEPKPPGVLDAACVDRHAGCIVGHQPPRQALP